jgi:tRNA(Ile)-lysidine synthase
MKTPVKLQNIFTNLKIPQAERHNRIVAVTERGEIFWVEGLRISERFKLDNQSVRRLKWKWQRL